MPQAVHSLLVLVGSAVAAVLAAELVDLVVRLVARYRSGRLLGVLRSSCRRPFQALLVCATLLVAVDHAGLRDEVRESLRHVLVLLCLATGAWLIVRAGFVAEELSFSRVRVDVENNRRARRQRTQIRLLRRLTGAAVVTVAVGFALLTLPGFRAIGTSVLASAGLLSVVAGLAAQTTLGNVFAGLQLAFTDALRLDDVIVVEQEWGRVEEVTLTYVVLALWDERRLVLPTSYFTSNPFQNWTRTESRVLGEVVLHLDYAVPVEPLRREAQAIVAASPLWDQKAWVLQVVDTTPSTMVVRVLASAPDAPSAFDLRCEIREKLLGWVQERHPQGLPHVRVAVAEAQPYDPYPTGRLTDVTAAGRGRSTFSSPDGPAPQG